MNKLSEWRTPAIALAVGLIAGPIISNLLGWQVSSSTMEEEVGAAVVEQQALFCEERARADAAYTTLPPSKRSISMRNANLSPRMRRCRAKTPPIAQLLVPARINSEPDKPCLDQRCDFDGARDPENGGAIIASSRIRSFSSSGQLRRRSRPVMISTRPIVPAPVLELLAKSVSKLGPAPELHQPQLTDRFRKTCAFSRKSGFQVYQAAHRSECLSALRLMRALPELSVASSDRRICGRITQI